jgi:hypothetical protein
MMSPETIRGISQEAAERAANEGQVPLLVENDDFDNLEEHIRKIPFLGDYVPEDWEICTDGEGYEIHYFVDASGFGQEGEPALTFQQFCDRVQVSRGYAITQQGQFQVYIGEYRRVNY